MTVMWIKILEYLKQLLFIYASKKCSNFYTIGNFFLFFYF